jgi:hypothetical protein
MIVLIAAETNTIAIMIPIATRTEVMAGIANKEMTTIPRIKEGMIGIVEIKEEATRMIGEAPMIEVTVTQTVTIVSVQEMTATGTLIATSEETDSNSSQEG